MHEGTTVAGHWIQVSDSDVCLVDGCGVKTQRATLQNVAQASPIGGLSRSGDLPLANYRASADPVLC